MIALSDIIEFIKNTFFIGVYYFLVYIYNEMTCWWCCEWVGSVGAPKAEKGLARIAAAFG